MNAATLPPEVLEILTTVRNLSTPDQISLAIALVSYAQDRTDPKSPLADALAGAQDDLTQAFSLIASGS